MVSIFYNNIRMSSTLVYGSQPKCQGGNVQEKIVQNQNCPRTKRTNLKFVVVVRERLLDVQLERIF